MGHTSLLFQNVTFSYDRATRPLIQNLTVSFPMGWTGIVGANGVGKTTLLKLASGELHPQEGMVVGSDHGIYCRQRTDDIPDQMKDFIHSIDGNAHDIRGRLGIKDDWNGRWSTLSHGERKRAQIGAAMWAMPHVLTIDEPTNHLDIEGQVFLFNALARFRGIGLLVSHDRMLLDKLCHQCLFIDPPEAILRHGNYSVAYQQIISEETSVRKQHDQAKREHARLKREASKRRDAASQSHRKRSKGKAGTKDHDAKAKINLARISGKDGADGKRLNQLAGRLLQAKEKQNNIKVKKEYTLGIWIPGARSKRDTLFRIAAGRLPLGNKRELEFPDLAMKPDDRIALTGSNGSGKSTLVVHIIKSLNLAKEQVTYVPQEIDIGASQEIMARAHNLPKEKLGQMMTVVSRLGSRPQRLLESVTPSPGEIRKILIATGVANVPHLIIMDEPTNHLDLPSIKCLEEALMGCPCGLLLVSHDQQFLKTVTRKRWHIAKADQKNDRFKLVQDSGSFR